MSDGLDRLPQVLDHIQEGIEDGLHLGAQLYVALDDVTVADGAVGEAAEGVPMRPDMVAMWLSAGKPVTAVAIAQLNEQGRLGYERPASEYIPEFGQNGKEGVTVRQVLTHTGGFRTGEAADRLHSREQIIAAICAAPLETGWTPGEDAAYHLTAGWHILGEIIRRVDGRPFEEYVRQEILEPLGMKDTYTFITARDLVETPDRFVPMHAMEHGRARVMRRYMPEAMGTFPRPGSSLRGPAHDLGRLYRTLLNGGELEGRRVLSPESAAQMTSPQRVRLMDKTFRHVMDWGLGVIMDNKHHGPAAPYGYGPHASPSAFGHGGSQSSVGFADPEHGLAVALVFNGMPGEPRHDRRLKRVTAAIYEELGLA